MNAVLTLQMLSPAVTGFCESWVSCTSNVSCKSDVSCQSNISNWNLM